MRAVGDWVHDPRCDYRPDATSPTGGAIETLDAGAGVCRDFAHLTAALLRALDVPARLVSVYAPQLDPMDFHAVVEALVDGRWVVVDSTRLAPRAGLVRIATGRDAADTAFLTNTLADVELLALRSTCRVDEDVRPTTPTSSSSSAERRPLQRRERRRMIGSASPGSRNYGELDDHPVAALEDDRRRRRRRSR